MTSHRDFEPLQFSYQLSRREYTKIARGLMFSLPRQMWIPYFASGVTLLGVVLQLTSKGSWATSLLDIGLFWLLCLVVGVLAIPLVAWRRDPSLRLPRSITVLESGLESKTSHRSSNFDWAAFKSVIEIPEAFLFTVTGQRAAVVLPKLAVSNPDDLGVIRNLA